MKSISLSTSKFCVAVAIVMCSSGCFAVEYKSFEFNDKKSRISNVYICAVVGLRMSYEPAAFQILEKFESISKVSKEKSVLWKSDAELWWNSERQNFNLKGFWDGECAAPFERIKKL